MSFKNFTLRRSYTSYGNDNIANGFILPLKVVIMITMKKFE